ncbi:SPOR domain-containing protein [Maribacter aestuarii]|uniref:SPOR domain-containing protein n=1 Tax=Maribacter aestuarii TaxID=1130723 RepID=UPI00248D1F8D|nr:SPOR domain-containing protein [Maribacter aestuarii]
MKTIVYTVILVCFSAISHAQNADINIEQDEKIDRLLNIYKSALSSSEYYRIQVGFGNSDKAQAIKSDVEIDFPELPSRIDFDSPTYRVRVGRFKTKLEAERKFNEVRAKYPDAMLLKPKKSTK